ncbi:hypothetical protein V3851_26325 [Paenibacillus sp. M1]|uniref:Uncharacterized protein n=1 Tax=Paenibacillus haidiansis TaxID=1574488 RepID=A0ABU7VZU3_9BACL
MKYCPPEIPGIYWIKKDIYMCKSCGHEFEYFMSNGDDIVKYKEKDGYEIKWLPTYTKGGYLDLMQKLIPNFKYNDQITMRIAKEFNSKLSYYIEKSSNGKIFILDDAVVFCNRCNSKELQNVGEIILTSPQISWLKISCELLNLDYNSQ